MGGQKFRILKISVGDSFKFLYDPGITKCKVSIVIFRTCMPPIIRAIRILDFKIKYSP